MTFLHNPGHWLISLEPELKKKKKNSTKTKEIFCKFIFEKQGLTCLNSSKCFGIAQFGSVIFQPPSLICSTVLYVRGIWCSHEALERFSMLKASASERYRRSNLSQVQLASFKRWSLKGATTLEVFQKISGSVLHLSLWRCSAFPHLTALSGNSCVPPYPVLYHTQPNNL